MGHTILCYQQHYFLFQLNEKVDQCANQLENIRDRVTDCYQPSVHPEKLEEELGTLDEIVHDLEKLDVYVDKLHSGIENCSPTSRKKFGEPSESIESNFRKFIFMLSLGDGHTNNNVLWVYN